MARPIEKFGVQAEKARVITVFRNGDRHHDGVIITLNMKKFKNYDQARHSRPLYAYQFDIMFLIAPCSSKERCRVW